MIEGIIFHLENLEDIEELDTEEKGMIFEAMIGYAISGNEPQFEERALRQAWKPIRRRLQKDLENYQKTCESRRANGAKGGRPKKTEENLKNQMVILVSEEENLKKPKKANGYNTNTNTKPNTNTNNNYIVEQEELDESASVPYKDIIEYLNVKAGTSFKYDSKDTRRHIKARWAEGFRMDEFKTVIDKKVEEWKSDPKMSIYIRPLTLFSTKFESYLNQKAVKARTTAFVNFEQRPDSEYDDLEAKLDRQFAGGL